MPELSPGILKAGGAYVPLDPAYPKERLAFILRDTRVCMLPTQQSLSENLPEVPEVEVFRCCLYELQRLFNRDLSP
jgi:non-ribosomal peptide synthetase component F